MRILKIISLHTQFFAQNFYNNFHNVEIETQPIARLALSTKITPTISNHVTIALSIDQRYSPSYPREREKNRSIDRSIENS